MKVYILAMDINSYDGEWIQSIWSTQEKAKEELANKNDGDYLIFEVEMDVDEIKESILI